MTKAFKIHVYGVYCAKCTAKIFDVLDRLKASAEEETVERGDDSHCFGCKERLEDKGEGL